MYTEIFFGQKNCTKLKMKLGIHAANEISLRHCLIHSFLRWRDLFVLRFMIIIVVRVGVGVVVVVVAAVCIAQF